MSNVRIFTTPVLDGIRIKDYKGMVIIRNVTAVSIVHDMLTRVKEIVGGRSGSYQAVMKKMEDETIEEAKKQALSMGGNAIVGFDLDFSSVDGLLMASTKGMAVLIDEGQG